MVNSKRIVTKEKSCGAIVYRSQDDSIQLLLIQHRSGGHWSFPKGHVESGETEKQTALREVKEETGLDIQLLDGFRQQVNYSPCPGVSKDVVYFLGYAEDSKTVRQEEEISALRWSDINTAGKHLSFQNDRQLLSSAQKYIRSNAEKIPK